jgi:hypothetical protein
MKAFLLISALLPVCASAQTVTGPVGSLGEGVPVPLAGVADPQAENLAFSMLTNYSVCPDEYLSIRVGELRGLLASGSKPERAAARAVLWAVSHDVEAYSQGVSVGLQHAMISASQRTRTLRARVPGLHEVLESAAREADAVEPAPTAIMKVEAAEPPAIVAKAKLKSTKLASLGSKDIMAVWEREMTVHERGVEALNDRDSELASHFEEDTKLGWNANGSLAKALDNVGPKTPRPLVAATVLDEASKKLGTPAKAQMMFRFIDATLHPDFKRPASERRLTITAVTALYDQLGWGSNPLEQAIRRHLDARSSGVPTAAPETTALVIQTPSQPSAATTALAPVEARVHALFKTATGAGILAAIVSHAAGSGLGIAVAVSLLGSFCVLFLMHYVGGFWRRPAEIPDADVLAALKELDAEFPTQSHEEVERRFRVLLEQNPTAAELEAEEEEELRERLKRLQS